MAENRVRNDLCRLAFKDLQAITAGCQHPSGWRSVEHQDATSREPVSIKSESGNASTVATMDLLRET